ncbi:MAG TPA: AAA family ATPase [Thermoanaerobaculia bacterium]
MPKKTDSPRGGPRRAPPSGGPGAFLAEPGELRVRLLGGFEVWWQGRQVGGFESQKVRALLAYLLCHRSRAFSRDHLTGLLWPEKDPDAARHALRQAIYNLKSVLPGGGSPQPPILSSHAGLQLNPECRVWLDVEAFEDALRRGRGREASDPQQLTTAAQLYRGELLAGFFVKDCLSFEDWLVAEQERLREAAVEVLRILAELYSRRGEHRFAIHYARRLVALEPLSEEAYRELMRLHALGGRRSRALAEYEKLQTLLRNELGVEPLEETRALYESILLDAREEAAPVEDAEPIGPLVPLVGRAEALAALREPWQRVFEGEGRLTLVTGEAGVGKTRLIKSFLDSVTSQRRALVLKGRGYELAAPVPYLPFREVLGNAIAEESEVAERALASLPAEALSDLALLFPELCELRPDLPVPSPLPEGVGRERLFESVARFLEELCDGSGEGDPLILLLDDLHLADRDTFDLLEHLLVRLERCPVWIVAAYRPAEVDPKHPLSRLGDLRAGPPAVVSIERLPPSALREIAEFLVGEEQAPVLAHLLTSRTGGLPLAVAELINFLWDEGALVPREGGVWRLAGDSGPLHLPRTGGLDDMILRRIRRLPTSTRRLVALAAVASSSFESGLLEKAGEEHPLVVEVGLELMLKRWLIRQFSPYWSSGRRERDIVLWARGARRGSFEFAHPRIRSAIYEDINPLRRQAMHGQVGAALETLYGDRTERSCEMLAYHFTAAGQWEKAAVYLEMAARKASALQAVETARYYRRQALEVRERLETSAGGGRFAAKLKPT